MVGEATWTTTDALVLKVVSRWPGVDLKWLLGGSDYVNRSYPSEQELSRSLGRLVASGLVETRKERFRRTRVGTRVVRRSGEREAALGISEALIEALREVPLSDATWPLGPGAYDEALEAYISRGR